MSEGVKGNISAPPLRGGDRNGSSVNSIPRNNKRTSLVQAPAVIPALMAYIKVAAVKTLVVGTESGFFLGSWETAVSGPGSPGLGRYDSVTAGLLLFNRRFAFGLSPCTYHE